MKYGESVFDILYLLFAVISGCYLLKKAGNQAQKRMALPRWFLVAATRSIWCPAC